MTLYEQYTDKLRRIADVNHSIAVLSWDQETQLPTKGSAIRAQQLSTLAGISYELTVSKELGDLLQQLQANANTLTEEQRRNVAHTVKLYNKKQKYSKEFVIELSRTTSECFQAWRKAKAANDFSLFAPSLEKMVDLKRQECEIIGYDDHPYDALLDEYEAGEKTANLNVLFADVRRQLVEFVKEISDHEQVASDWMYKHYNKDKQWNFGLEILKQMGYDFQAGRQDVSAHPFTTSFGSTDVRVTTRINENDFHEMLWSCIHEGGHALYEQGFKTENYGLPAGEAISLGIHESQSRLWENNVGRSLPFWKANYKNLQNIFPENLNTIALESFYRSMNKVAPSLIRTNADELTYHFHILVRFEIEKALIEGSIEVKDLANTWNQRYKEYLGIDVPSDAEGVLQDIHWSHGSFGYFPTYSLGSFYAAQFYHQAKQDIPNLEQAIASGDMEPMFNWLRTNIHQHGKLFSAEELCVRLTGEKLNFKYFMDYAREKYAYIYNLAPSLS